MKKIAVILSGCGYKDGSEITESISVLVALSELGVQYEIFAPDLDVETTDHLSENSTNNKRNILHEAARIARGQVKDIKSLNPDHYEALAMPGGFGAALHLCDFAVKGSKASVHPEVRRVVESFYRSSKPIGAACIAPAVLALVLGSKGVTLTVGEKGEASAEIEKTGAHHELCAVDNFVTDREHKVVTTPAYMYDDAKPHLVFKGIRLAMQELCEMA